MNPTNRAGSDELPVPDADFLPLFLPYEVRLAQRRAMVWDSSTTGVPPNAFIGLYVFRLEPISGDWFPSTIEGGKQLGAHACELLREAMRDSDIPVRISDQEHLAVLRDIDPQHAYVVAQRIITSAGRSDLLNAANLRTRVGYVVYPLSTQPNFPPSRWETLLDLARRMSKRGDTAGPASGYGILRGSQMESTGIPETDLIPLAFQDPDSLVRAGILQVQRIHLLPAM